jgi:hypothetical protein
VVPAHQERPRRSADRARGTGWKQSRPHGERTDQDGAILRKCGASRGCASSSRMGAQGSTA